VISFRQTPGNCLTSVGRIEKKSSLLQSVQFVSEVLTSSNSPSIKKYFDHFSFQTTAAKMQRNCSGAGFVCIACQVKSRIVQASSAMTAAERVKADSAYIESMMSRAATGYGACSG
jgi:hypothetical protein